KPTHHVLDRDQLSTYIYPTNLPIRDYQYSIVYRALFHNVLVVLPTGLGKTFIASTVMLNFLRWFPQLKIIFMAPTKPLVAQQIKACCGITGLPQSKVAIMLDRTRKNRAEVWADKSVFFTTPQVVENDLAAGIVDPKLIVLLVVDEAHSAKGNYAYNNVVKFVSRFLNSFRILALTATPAADVDGVQEIVDNLHISYVEARSESSIDIFKYLKRKKVERITVEVSDEVRGVIDALCEAAAPILRTANEKGIYEVTDPARINAYTALDAQRRVAANKGMPEGLKWANYFILQLLIVVGQCLRRLNIYGVRSFYEYFSEKHAEFSTKYNMGKSKNHMAAKFYFHPSVKFVLARFATLVSDPKFLGSPKLAIVVSELGKFFENTSDDNSRVIIFTEFRLSASDIVRAIENTFASVSLRPHIFIGQAKEKDRFDEEKYAKKGMKSKGASKKGQDTANKTSSELAQQSGMNQKQQKQVIKDFKSGKHNILVATSIGEEGLDIGEVDLIICFDSTSSPIKNIQRMGRTGRSRDGKVILLFSINEETKFDKAIAGYEYIQEHIMKGLVTMNEQNRILPEDVTPVVEERKIEITRENMDIVKEEDEDEIIRLATRYMATQTGKRASKRQTKLASARGSKESVQKRFFMPDDVETGFRPARAVLRGEDPEAKR
ncbi:P-loop containing nucleoside triphosphate hydrolase protein, partial [Metschnikowia bicuspidata]